MIVVSILDNSITHAHTYVIVVLCVSVAMHGHLPSEEKRDEKSAVAVLYLHLRSIGGTMTPI